MAITGEINLRGDICRVGGILEKLEGARVAGFSKVLIPQENMVEWREDVAMGKVNPVLQAYGDAVLHPVGHLMEAIQVMVAGGLVGMVFSWREGLY